MLFAVRHSLARFSFGLEQRVSGLDLDRLRLGNYIAADQRACMRQLVPLWSRGNESVEPATQNFNGATVLGKLKICKGQQT